MIIINSTPKADVIVAIDKETVYLQGLADTIQLLADYPDNIRRVGAYIQKNAVLKGIENDLRKSLGGSGDLLGSLNGAIGQLLVWLPKLKDRIVKNKTSVYDVETITFKEKGILNAISSINFFSRYAGIVMDILISEADKETSLNEILTKSDITFFNNTAKYFSILVIRFSQSVKDLEKMIDNLSEEVYDATSESIIRSQLGEGSVSVQRNLTPHELNPLYYYKLHKMKKDVKGIISAEADIDMLALKIARLNNRRTGIEDPALDSQIEVYQNELIKKQGKIAEIEARYGNRV